MIFQKKRGLYLMKDLIFFDFMDAFHTQLRPFTITSSQFILEQATLISDKMRKLVWLSFFFILLTIFTLIKIW